MRRTVSLIIALLVAVAAPAVAQTNIALNKAVTASSTEGTFAPRQGVDGNGNTRWGSGFGTKAATNQEWFLVDLGATYALTGVKVVWESAYAERYQVQTSLDGATFQTV